MKKQLMILAVSVFSLLIACNNSDSTTKDSTMDSITTSSSTSTDKIVATSGNDGMPVFYSLNTKQPVQVMEDENSHQYVDVSTHQPVGYYYEPISKHTFDERVDL